MRRAKVLLSASAAFGVASAFAPRAMAWKPETHVYLAKQAWDDAVDDGYVKIYQTDYASGRVACDASGRPKLLGTDPRGFEVEPKVLAALRTHPEKYFAGVLGPDAYPDIVTGQERIHPPGSASGADSNAGGAGTDPWLEQLWSAAWSSASPDPAILAWVIGFLDHAAGDVYAHTFMNTFAGGIFDMTTTNFLKHVTVEGYIEERTPPIGPIAAPAVTGGPPVTFPEIHGLVGSDGVSGIESFIAENTADVPQAARNEAHKAISVPYVLEQLDQALTRQVDAYAAYDASVTGQWAEAMYLASPVGAGAELAYACTNGPCPDPSYSTATCPADRFPGGPGACAALGFGGIVGWQVGEQLLADALLPAVGAIQSAVPIIQSQRDRRDAVRRARVAWIDGGHGAGTSIFFTENRLFDHDTFNAAYVPFKNELVDVALGAPQPVAQGLIALNDLLGLPLDTIDSLLSTVKDDVFRWAFQTAFNMSVDDARNRFTKPHVYFNPLFSGSSPPATLASTNAILRLRPPPPAAASCSVVPPGGGAAVDVSGACDLLTGPATATFSVAPACDATAQQPFPAAVNAVTMIKLSFLSPAAIERFRTEVMPASTPAGVAGGGAFAPPNVMLGFAADIDGSHQWAATQGGLSVGAMPMLVARDCGTYQRTFLDQRPDFLPGGTRLDPAHRPSPPVLGLPWEPPATTGTCVIPPPLPAIALTPRGAHVRYEGTLSFFASEPVIVDPPTAGSVDPTSGPTTRFTYHAPPLAQSATSARVNVHTQDGRTAWQVVMFDSGTASVAHLDYRIPGRTPVGDPALRAGDRAILTAERGEATWTIVSGPGTIGDVAAERTFAAAMQAHETRLSAFATQARASAQTAAAPLCAAACRAQALTATMRVVAARQAFLASEHTALVAAQKAVALGRATYAAPTSIARDETVVLRGTTPDGSTTTLVLRLAAAPAPLVAKVPPVVHARQTVPLAVDGGVPVTWTLVGAPGGMIGDPGSPERATLERTTAPYVARLKTYDAQLAKETDPRRRAALAEARMKEEIAGAKQAGAALERIASIDSAYHAPLGVHVKTRVTVRATATDGSGRTAVASFDLLP